MATVIPKSVIVTGGASGIGLTMSRHFASWGYRVAILDINADSGPGIATEIAAEFPESTVSFRKCDVSSWDDQAAAFKAVFHEHGGGIDIVMANAGISEQGSTTAVDLAEVDEPLPPKLAAIQVNLIGVMYSVKLAVHYMRKNETKGGSIICTASNAGLYPFPTAPLYAASKFGVIGLVRSLAKVVAKSNIRINVLAPAVLATNIAPDKALFKDMIMTPMSTIVKGISELLEDPTLNGQVAEIHGDNVTLRPHHEFVDAASQKNLETFWNLGYA
ncbi:hypothetical protein B0T22DRAFT_481142 [Podospora appendiculata]|uniref:Short chain dehydrogenase/reductase n=1 Tax=Podospora appendiculata TaxID=314037 RepID=A0AAE0XC24_9PEZI|nr:hypothetical protein B0T22DRAFT_481142 [Podospora appendiculata]